MFDMNTTSPNRSSHQAALYSPSSVWEMTTTIQWYARKEISTSDHDVIHDITRTVQSRIARRPQGFNKSFLRKVIRNVAIDYLRSMYSDRKIIDFSALSEDNPNRCILESPESTVLKRAVITAAQQQLPAWLFESFEQMAEGTTQRDVYDSYALNHCKSYGDFRQIIFRTRKKLQSAWN